MLGEANIVAATILKQKSKLAFRNIKTLCDQCEKRNTSKTILS